MRARLPSIGVSSKSESKWAELVRYVLFFGVIVIIIGVGWLAIDHFFNKDTKTSSGPTPVQKIQKNENTQMLLNNQALKAGDVDAYMTSQNIIAKNYMDYNSYSDAKRVMDNIQSKVPADKWDLQTYMNLSAVAKHDGDTAAYKKYTSTLITMLRKVGDNADADTYAKDLQAVK